MEEIDQEIVQQLRRSAASGMLLSGMLRELISRIGLARAYPITLLRYVREAFDLSVGQAKPVAGWVLQLTKCGDGLSDEELDQFVMPEIMGTRFSWENRHKNAPPVLARI